MALYHAEVTSLSKPYPPKTSPPNLQDCPFLEFMALKRTEVQSWEIHCNSWRATIAAAVGGGSRWVAVRMREEEREGVTGIERRESERREVQRTGRKQRRENGIFSPASVLWVLTCKN